MSECVWCGSEGDWLDDTCVDCDADRATCSGCGQDWDVSLLNEVADGQVIDLLCGRCENNVDILNAL